MMDPVAERSLLDFERKVRAMSPGIAGSTEFLLSSLDSDVRYLVRLCAIPHWFNVDLIRVMDSSFQDVALTDRLRHITRMSIVTRLDDAFTLHGGARDYLFSWWLTTDPKGRFREVSRRLADYFANLRGTESVGDEIDTERQSIYHLTGADANKGFDEFASACRRERRGMRLGNCQALIEGMRQYFPILPSSYRLWLDYHHAKLLADRRMWREAQEALERLVDGSAGLPEISCRSWYRLGLVHGMQNRWSRALEAFARAERLAQENREAADQLNRIYDGVATTYRDMGNSDRAAEWYRRSIALSMELGYSSTAASAYTGLGTVYQGRGQTELALDAFVQSVALLEQSGSRLQLGRGYSNVGLVYADRGDWASSRKFLEMSLEALVEAGDSFGRGTVLLNLMRTYANLGAAECDRGGWSLGARAVLVDTGMGPSGYG